jgi:uncharacterized protein
MISAQHYGPWALITGGSEGVGAAFARQLGKAGINLILIARREGPLEDLAKTIRSACGVNVRTLPFDLSRPDVLEHIQEATADVEIGLLVCNVGTVFGSGPFLDFELEGILRTIRLNSMGHAVLSHHFGRKMLARKRGGIILVGSLAGNAGGATMVLYSAGKAFAQIFAEGLWAELKPKGVDVLYVVLGATDTPSRARQNLKDGPDQFVADPDDVAREALDNIANGPVLVPAHLEEGFRLFSSMPRRQAAEAMRDLLKGFTASAETKTG